MTALVVAGAVLLVAARLVDHRPAALAVTVSGGSATVGLVAPDFTTQTLDGATVRLSQLHGKPVLLNFWATWCTACEIEMPAIQRASDRYGRQGLTVLAVNYHQTNAADMRVFLKRLGARFAAVYDPDGRIATAYGVAIGLPVSVFIGRTGKVAFMQVGQMSNPLLDEKVHSIL
jgi:cytochrome c biogenesis protein CcmG, thiol:disulfide interchange protein DsbE